MYGIYIHIPFCLKKCKYCDFVSFDNKEDLKEKYIDLLIKEMDEYKGIKADTVFIGGGTPSALSEAELKRLLEKINEIFLISEDAEFTIEANPQTLNAEKLHIMKNCGVNRISVGVQSFCDDELLKIGRIHNSKTAQETIELIKKEGFLNFNIDLMSALPSQSFESFKKSLEIAVSKNPSHISCYSLILEEGTPLFDEYKSGKLNLPSEETERKMYEYACKYLENCGYNQYEISNFSKNGYGSKHNIKYWECREYIGIGLSAHSYFKGERYQNTADIFEYLAGNFHLDKKEKLSQKDKIEEFMIMGLRMTKGIKKSEFKNRFGKDIEEVYKDQLDKFLKKGFLKETDDRIALSKEAISVSNQILCEFII